MESPSRSLVRQEGHRENSRTSKRACVPGANDDVIAFEAFVSELRVRCSSSARAKLEQRRTFDYFVVLHCCVRVRWIELRNSRKSPCSISQASTWPINGGVVGGVSGSSVL